MVSHARIVNCLEERLREKGHFFIDKYFDFDHHVTGNGEIDLMVNHMNGTYCVYEVKSKNTQSSRSKAKKQLERAEKYLKVRLGAKRVWKIYHAPGVYQKIR